jgi:hypothetical protein
MLSITNPISANSANSANSGNIAPFLERLEKTLESGNTNSFLKLLHPAIIKDEAEKRAIFANTLDSYEIKGKKLQRSYLYELEINSSKPVTECRNHLVTAVVGPKRQFAIEYAFTNAGEQARIVFLIGTVPKALQRQKGKADGTKVTGSENT